jgi:hypothetical protein
VIVATQYGMSSLMFCPRSPHLPFFFFFFFFLYPTVEDRCG